MLSAARAKSPMPTPEALGGLRVVQAPVKRTSAPAVPARSRSAARCVRLALVMQEPIGRQPRMAHTQGSAMADPQQPKLIVDTDWKSQAQAEKERLSPTPPPQAGPVDPGQAGAEEDPDAPPTANLREIVKLLATQALLYLGAIPDPETGRAMVAPEVARLYIDLLGVLEAKTKGNLTEDENRFLTRTAAELRMEYVEISKAVAKAIEEGRIRPSSGSVMGGPTIAGPGMGGAGPVQGMGRTPPIR